ncbi:hypothetical protein JCM10449v2_000497 [Rhodotorula kratochvilovae]
MFKGRLWPFVALCAAVVASLWVSVALLLDSSVFSVPTAASYTRVLAAARGADTAAPACAVDQSLLQTYGRSALRLSRVHEGSGYRVQRVLERLEKGEHIKAAVIGGSVSNGHGMSADGVPFTYGAVKDTWHTFVSAWLNETYGPQSFLNGAMAATDSSFFRFCWPERVRLEEQAPDLVFVELDVNDIADDTARRGSESLVRSILLLPNKPAVIFVGAFALVSQSSKDGILNGGDAHASVAAYYDVPQISLRGPLLPALMQNHSLARPWFNGDPRHIAAPLHRALGDMLIAYLQEQRCAREVDDPFVPSELFPTQTFLGEVPSRLMHDKWDSTVKHASSPPTCRIAGSTLEPASSSPGWSLYSFREVKTYLEAMAAGRTVEFDVEVKEGGAGEVGVGFLRSPQYKLGKAECRVGGQVKVLDGNWARKASLTEIEIVATGLTPGWHRLSCATLGKARAFRIAAVISA